MSEKIAFLIPCKNEAKPLPKVIKSIRSKFPEASIVIGDNASEDNTSNIAKSLGCQVIYEGQPGKGNTVRKLLNSIEADYYFVVDGDSTYDISSTTLMLKILKSKNLDMVVGIRNNTKFKEIERRGHALGNLIINKIYNFLFGSNYTDILSGYRLITKKFVKTFPASSKGFEIEVEMNSHAILLGNSVEEVATEYIPRMDGSKSKLNTYKDGMKILKAIIGLSLSIKPFRLFTVLYFPIYILAILLSMRVFIPYVKFGIVPNVPSLIVAVALFTICFIGLTSAYVIQTITRNQVAILTVLSRD